MIHGPDSFLYSPTEQNAHALQERILQHDEDWLTLVPSIFYRHPVYESLVARDRTFTLEKFLTGNTIMDLLQGCVQRATDFVFSYQLFDPMEAEFLGFHSAVSRIPGLPVSPAAEPEHRQDYPVEGIGHVAMQDWFLLHVMPVHNFGRAHDKNQSEQPKDFMTDENFSILISAMSQVFDSPDLPLWTPTLTTQDLIQTNVDNTLMDEVEQQMHAEQNDNLLQKINELADVVASWENDMAEKQSSIRKLHEALPENNKFQFDHFLSWRKRS